MLYMHLRIYTRGVDCIADRRFDGDRARFEALRSVWSQPRLILPSVIAHNTTVELRPRRIGRGPISPYPLCILHKHTYVYTAATHAGWRDTRGGSIHGAAIDFGVTRRGLSFQSRQIRNGLHHFMKTMRRRRNESIRDFSIPIDDAVGRFLFICLPFPRHSYSPLRITKRASCFVAEKIERSAYNLIISLEFRDLIDNYIYIYIWDKYATRGKSYAR